MASSTASSGWRRSTHEEHLARHHVARVRLVLDQRRRWRRRGACARPIASTALDQARGAEQRVLAQMHRRGAGVRVLAGDRHLVPAHRLHAGDDADVLALGFQDRPLLDVQLEERRQRMLAAALGAAIADRVERRAEGRAGAVRAGVRPVALEHPGEHAGGDHGRREARALLVGPVHHLDRRVGLVAGLVAACAAPRARPARRARRRTCRRSAGCRDGCRSRSAARRPLPVAAREHRAHVVDGDAAAERLGARAEPVAHLPVEIGQRQPADAALRRAADRGGLHQLAPQPLGVDREIAHRDAHQPRARAARPAPRASGATR